MAARYGLEIRSAAATDAAGLVELLAEAGLSASSRTMADRLEAVRSDGGVVLVAMEWGPPSGVIALSWRPSLQADGLVAEITTLLVGGDARRRGIGRLLLKAGSQAARAAGCGALCLFAPPDRFDLEDFCRATGFAETGRGFERALRKRA